MWKTNTSQKVFAFEISFYISPDLKSTKEIKALFHLLDDPDREIFETVSHKIVDYGKEIIPNLEELWEKTADNSIQERIENLIHKVNFTDTENGFKAWFEAENQNLLEGAILLSHFRFAEINTDEKEWNRPTGRHWQASESMSIFFSINFIRVPNFRI